MKQKRHYKILISLRLDIMPGRQELIGIFRYIKRKGVRWDILLRSPAELSPDMFSAGNAPDGVIHAESQLSAVAEELVNSDIPIVSIDTPPEILAKRARNIVFVHADNEFIGRACMRHLSGKGRFASWGFVHDTHHRPWSHTRRQAFVAAVRAAGGRFVPMTEKDEANMPEWLESLPKPAALMVACDRRAIQVLEACREKRIKVPEQVVIVSVDNDEMYCECVSPTISSLDPDFENEGYIAAAELDRMLLRRSHSGLTARTITTPARKVVERESTSPIPTSALLAHRALAFITAYAHTGIGVKDVVEELGASRRLVDLRFRQYCGKSILEAIIDQRVAKAKRLLSGSGMKMSKIAESCGFSSAKHMSVMFRKRCGVSLSDYRNRHR